MKNHRPADPFCECHACTFKGSDAHQLAALTQAPLYRLVLSHPDWPRETRTKWQESPDFTKALAKAKELGVTARVESQK